MSYVENEQSSATDEIEGHTVRSITQALILGQLFAEGLSRVIVIRFAHVNSVNVCRNTS